MTIADRVNLSVPSGRHHEIHRHVKDIVAHLGGHFVKHDLLRVQSGTIKVHERPRFTNYSVSGAMCGELRAHNMLSQFLFPFGDGSHSVTHLHIAQDFLVDGPTILLPLKRRAQSSGVRLTRKQVKPQNVTFYESHNHFDPGTPTGMLYIGSKSAEVRAGVYDKRCERVDRGHDDPGPLTRGELRISGKMGITLRDVVEPDPCYWHYMSDIFQRPPSVPMWAPRQSDYQLEPPMTLEPYELLKRRVETSPDLDHMIELADRLGPRGFDTLVRLLEQKRQRHPVQPAASVEAA